jgi:para-nitrobenzyl esterase
MTEIRRFACVTATVLALTACSNDSPGQGPADAQGRDSAGSDADGTVPGHVATDKGPVIGHSDGTITAFLGVPYAAPPVDALRWRPPQPHDPWTEPIDAAALGPACAQSEGGLGQTGPYSEDCLTLNVWTPAPTSSAHAPVMVFLHGGAFVHGSSNQAGYDGRTLGAAGVVVVTLNYRLGVLGFLAHPALTAEDDHHSSGNVGVLDQQAALRWVHDNIARFGGDPANVTMFGESAGSMSVCVHLVSPLAAGLFHRALGESGACTNFATPLQAPAGTARPSAEALGVAVAHTLGCDTAADVLACMRGKSATEVIAAAPGSEDVVSGGAHLAPNIDGYVLPEPPAVAFAAARINPVDGLLIGTNHDEATLFTRMTTIETEAQYEAAVTALIPVHATEALALYPAASYPTIKDAYDALITDLVFVCPTRAELRALAGRGVASYQYELTRSTVFGTASGLGVYHGSELPFVFGNLSVRSGMSATDRAFASQLIGYWTRFAAAGDPNGGAAPSWPPYTIASEAYLDLAQLPQAGAALHRDRCEAMQQWRAAP